MSDETIEAIRRRANAATRAERWFYERAEFRGGFGTSGPVLQVGNWWDSQEMRAQDARFIAHARTDVPFLLDALAAERERAERAEAALAAVESQRDDAERQFQVFTNGYIAAVEESDLWRNRTKAAKSRLAEATELLRQSAIVHDNGTGCSVCEEVNAFLARLTPTEEDA